MRLKRFIEWLKNLMFPSGYCCIVCDRELQDAGQYWMCDRCIKELPRNNGKLCIRCGEQILNTSAIVCLNCKSSAPAFTQAFAPLLYKPPVSNLIRGLKYDNKRYLAEALGGFILTSYIENNLSCDFVVPVPLHLDRQRERGYNQSELLCGKLAEVIKLPIRTDIMERTKNTLSQADLEKQDRIKNVEEAFKVVNKKACKNAIILLVDDVYTTGSTLNACAKSLFKAGANKVYCITPAHTISAEEMARLRKEEDKNKQQKNVGLF